MLLSLLLSLVLCASTGFLALAVRRLRRRRGGVGRCIIFHAHEGGMMIFDVFYFMYHFLYIMG